MAFLCPVRIRTNTNGSRKKKHPSDPVKKRSFLSTVNSIIGDHSERASERIGGGTNVEAGRGDRASTHQEDGGSGPGRITGSSSIETLVRVGLEKEAGINPEARVVVLHDFTPCVDDELEVKRGSVVSILYRENDWVYVILEQLPNGVVCDNEGGGGREGFIPFSYCAAYGSTVADMALGSGGGGGVHGGSGSGGNTSKGKGGKGDVGSVPFYKDPSPTRYIALYKFTARDENDVNVERGEILTVLNKDDPEWFYVVRSDGQEGFVPSAFVYPIAQQQGQDCSSQNTYQQIDEQHEYSDAQHPPTSPHQGNSIPSSSTTTSPNTQAQTPEFSGSVQHSPPQQQYGTELVMLYDYKAQATDDLSLRRGDWVYADLLHQTVEGWLWAYAPKQRKYGFIPKAYARPPAMTSL